ncbi:MAG: ABC transporter permease [Lachnospiraceae bacterium]|nr:ABC transporter permease [Lachnospiraceae bacterium]
MQHFWYRIKMMLRTRSAVFWAVLFPIFLGMVFYFMFGNLGNAEQFSEVPVGVILEKENDIFIELLKETEMEEGLNMFEVYEYDSKEKAEDAMQKKEICGYILVKGEDFSLVVKKMDISSSLIKTFLDQYKQNYLMIEDVAKNKPEQMEKLITGLDSDEEVVVENISLKGQDKSPYTQYFYALLAMACLIASMVGLENGLKIQADLSAVGARRNVAPTGKMQQIMTDFLASLFIYCIMMTGVLAVLVFVYKQDFGNNAGFILLGTWAGSFVGLAAGNMMAVVFKGSKTKKEGLNVAFFMTSSFLGGLQWGDITYVLEKNCSVINRINPATLIVNAFKSLAVFGDYKQYAVNMITLLAIGVLLLIISILKLRRTKYASL